MLNVAIILLEDPFQEACNFPCFLLLLLLLSFKLCKAEVNDSVQTVVGSLADRADDFTEVCGVKVYEPGIDVVIILNTISKR